MTDPAITDLSKDAAARAATLLVEPGMRLGLGTGSTAAIFVRRLAERVQDEGFALRCAATSRATTELATSLGLKVEELDDIGWLDLTIDGADELDPDLKVMFITGFAAVALNPDSKAPKDAKVLSKPFHLRDLVEEVNKMLAA